MLSDYITDYVTAKKNGDTKEMSRIEKTLRSVGMDKLTLSVLVEAMSKTDAS